MREECEPEVVVAIRPVSVAVQPALAVEGRVVHEAVVHTVLILVKYLALLLTRVATNLYTTKNQQNKNHVLGYAPHRIEHEPYIRTVYIGLDGLGLGLGLC